MLLCTQKGAVTMDKKITPYIKDKLREEQKNIINCIGFEHYLMLANEFGGTSIYISKPTVIEKEERNNRIIEDYKAGLNFNQLAVKYGLTTVWIREITKDVIL